MQGLSTGCAYILASGLADSDRVGGFKIGAAVLLLVIPVGCIAYSYHFVRQKVVREARAHLVVTRAGACGLGSVCVWMDAPPTGAVQRKGAALMFTMKGGVRYAFTGFTERNGGLFEDFRRKGVRIYAVSVFLVHRFVVGVALGATVAPTPAGSRALVGFLAAAFLALLLFVALMRPFLVPIANVFEGPVEILQDTLFFQIERAALHSSGLGSSLLRSAPQNHDRTRSSSSSKA